MTTPNSGVSVSRRPLRVWPGVAAVVLLFLSRFGIKAAVPGFAGFAQGMQGALLAAVAVILWWLFASRAPWAERLGALALMAAGMYATWQLRHESMGPLWLLGYAVPFLCVAFVGWAVAGRRLADGPRRATMAATIVLACGGWMLARMEGISGDHVATFDWRWTKTAEEKLVTEAAGPEAPSPIPAAPTTSLPAPAATALPTEPVAPPSGDRPTAAAPAATGMETSADWPGFRGPRRDGVVRNARIGTDWSVSPPVELWRRPVGPGWSSFAVRGNHVYTQEQRGVDEIVTCYDATTGRPVWTHADAARFSESNAGPGPRATPTLAHGRVYTFGATGIVNALDADDGSVVWTRNVTSGDDSKIPYWGFSSSPLVVGDLVVIAAAGQLLAYDAATGTPRWSGPAAEGYSSPHLATIGGVPQIVLVNGAGVISVAPADGKVLWQHAWKGVPVVQPALTADGDLLIATQASSGTRRLAATLGPGGWTVARRWTSMGLKPYFNDFVVHEGHAFGFDGRILSCIDLADGAQKWKGGRYGNGQLILLPDQDVLLVLSEEGDLALVKAAPDQYTELARFKAVDGKTWNHPVLVRDVLLVRNGAEMAAFRLPVAPSAPHAAVPNRSDSAALLSKGEPR
jgi:outer membrane protein assembly factor BamB